MLVAAMNPCPCGYYGDNLHECVCTPQQIKRYRQRLSGPLLDRFDIQVEVPRLTFDELATEAKGESSVIIRQRVEEARSRQRERLARRGLTNNAEMGSQELEEFCCLDSEGKNLLQMAFEQLGLSARAYNRILRLARTIADLAGASDIMASHVAEAIQYRVLDRPILE